MLKRALQSVLGVLVLLALTLGYVTWSTSDDPVPNKLAREQQNTGQRIVADVTELNPVKVVDIVVPHTLDDIVEQVRQYDHVSIGGGRNSMGGQTASERAVQIDMREYNKVLTFSKTSKEVTVQAGARWRDIQDYIDPYGLAVKIMQTYANFTVGGSLSVNVHGRYVGLGPIILSVKSFRIVLADGSVVEATPTTNQDIFYSAIGGMGGIGVITDVTLELADNVNLRRSRVKLPTREYATYFADQVRPNPNVVFHNGDLYPPQFEAASAVSWSVTDEAPTTKDRLIPRAKDYWRERVAWVVMSQWPGGRWIREHFIDPIVYRGEAPVHTRNYEASYDTAELEPVGRGRSTYVLQEYFVPVARFDEWIPKMKRVFDRYDVNVINVSIRHAIGDPGAKLAWARGETFAFVVYYKQGTDEAEQAHAATWTRAMIDEVLSVGGTYYLPYQPHATDDQFHRAYPGAIEYFEIKKRYDPTDKFTNTLWDKYYSPEKLERYRHKRAVRRVAGGVAEYFRPVENAYLSLPEWYIVYSADEYAAVLRDGLPSDFDYFEARRDFWKQYDEVSRITASSPRDTRDSHTVLKVIGWSFSIENVLKGAYENTIGRLSEWVAGDTQVAEDQYAARVAQDYATFIYDYPWYDFPYFKYFKGVWTLDNRKDYTWLQDLRRFERKLFLSLEYGLKAIYAELIAFATHTKFGVQDDIVYAIVTRDGGATYELVKAPHYQPFTRLLLNELEREGENPHFQIADISGNELITLTYMDAVGAQSAGGGKEIVRDREIVGIRDGERQYRDRLTVEVTVADIPAVYRSLRARQVTIDHYYDY
jgi:FAD/FMN-containing dehydrogenase